MTRLRRGGLTTTLVKGVSLLVVPIVAIPLVYLAIRVFEADPADVWAELSRGSTAQLLGNTALLMVAVTATALVVGVTQAYAVTRTTMPWRKAMVIAATAPLAVPSYVAAYGWLGIWPEFTGFGAAWLVLSVSTAPIVFLTVSASLARTPRSLDDVARTFTTTLWGRHRLVTWPTIKTAVWGSGLLVALYVIADFGAVSLLRYDTFTRAIFIAYRSSFDRTAAAVLGIIVVVATTVLVIAHSRFSAQARTVSTAIESPRRDVVRWRGVPQVAAMTAWIAVGSGVPLVSIGLWLTRGVSTAGISQLLEALLASLAYAAVAATIATAVAIALSIARTAYGFVPARVGITLSWLIHALPALVVALALTFVGIRVVPDLYQTHGFIIAGLVVLFLPNALAAVEPAIRTVPQSWTEVAQSLGMSPTAQFRRVTLPVVAPGVAAAWALVALVIIKELPLTLLLRPTGIDTLATRLWTETNAGAFAASAPYAFTLVILAGIPAWLISRGSDPQRKVDTP